MGLMLSTMVESSSVISPTASLARSPSTSSLSMVSSSLTNAINITYSTMSVSSSLFSSYSECSGNCQSNNVVEENAEVMQLTAEKICYVVFGTLLSLIIIVGNSLVLLAFKSNRSLRTVTNYFIISLAAADLIIGVIPVNALTISIVYEKWPFGQHVCDVYLSLEFLTCQASVFGLVAICVDRYLSLSSPLKYRIKRTSSLAKVVVGVVWLLAFLVWVPLIVLYQYITGERTVPSDECYVQLLSKSIIFAYIPEFLSFELANGIMIILYIKIYILIRKRRIEQRRIDAFPTENIMGNTLNMKRHCQRKDRGLKTVQMIAAIIALNFFLWLPYHVTALILPVNSGLLSENYINAAYYIAYSNSALNPICYAVLNPPIRRQMIRVLFCSKVKQTGYIHDNSINHNLTDS